MRHSMIPRGYTCADRRNRGVWFGSRVQRNFLYTRCIGVAAAKGVYQFLWAIMG